MSHSNLPVQLTSFIGREREIAEVKRLLFDAHIVTLTGTGGSGKTRLAIQIADAMRGAFRDGAWLVDLAPLREPALVPQFAALAIGLHLPVDQPLLETLLRFVKSKQLLLVLDNCEHLREACAELAQALLSTSPGLRILATSREPLVVAGETIFPVAGLAMPAANAAPGGDAQDLLQFDAVRLFVERGRAITPGFTLTPENAAPIVEICRRLDGLPLALELASARVNMFTVHEINARLNDRLALLGSNSPTWRDPRHQSLRAAIDWSYSLLTAGEQVLLRRLGVFSAGCTLDLVEAICAGEGLNEGQIIGVLSALVDKSLMLAETSGRSQARYNCLETIREYALEKLEEAGESRHLRDAHLDVFLARAEEAAPKLNEAYQQVWLNWLEGEHDNLRAALGWALHSGRIEAGLRIAIALIRFWEIRGYIREGLTWFERFLARADERIPWPVHANALTFASFMAMFLGDGAAATTFGQKAVDIAESVGDDHDPILILALSGLSSSARIKGDFQTAFTIGERGIDLLRDSTAPAYYLGMALLAQGSVAIELGYLDYARTTLNESLAIAREAGDAFRIAHALNSLGDLARCERTYEAARKAYEESVRLLREVNALHDLASVLQNLGHTFLHLGDIERAHVLFRESMETHQTFQNVTGMAECLVGFAAIAILRGLPGAGVRLLGAAATVGGQRVAAASIWHATRMEYEHYLAAARKGLSEAEFQAEQAAGFGLTLEQAVNYAMTLPLKREVEPAIAVAPDGLTRREREIARLIGQGKSNGEIAIELVLSKRTVETHVGNILSKLELSTRAQLMRWAMDRGSSLTPA